MKRLLILSVFALSAGCIEPGSVLLLNAQVLDDACKPTGTQIYAGDVDVSQTSSYYVAFQVQSELDSSDITVNGNIVNPGSRNDYIASTATLTYVNPVNGTAIPGVAPQSIPMSAVIPAGSRASESYIVMNLLNSTIAGTLPAGQVAVRVQLLGKLMAGNTTLATNTVQFPLTLINSASSGLTCVANPKPPCGNAYQDVICN